MLILPRPASCGAAVAQQADIFLWLSWEPAFKSRKRQNGVQTLQHCKIRFCFSLPPSNLQTKTSYPEGNFWAAWIFNSLNGSVELPQNQYALS